MTAEQQIKDTVTANDVVLFMKGTKSMLSPKNLDRLGFTQYKRAGDGHYEKTAGGGPRVIKGD